MRAREDEIRLKSTEWATAWDPSTGRMVLNKTDGRKGTVTFTDQEALLVRGTIFTHNHPSSASFSLADVAFAIRNDLAEMRAVPRAVAYPVQEAGLALQLPENQAPMILIDPPVSMYSEPDEIRAWIAELEQLRREHAGDPADLRLVDASIKAARGWLDRSQGQDTA